MKRIGIIKISITLFACIICVASIKKIVNHLFSIDGYACTFDSVISQDYKNKIFNFLNENGRLKKASLKVLSDEIRKNFPVIRALNIWHSANGILHVRFSIFDPRFVLNSMYVLTENKTIFIKAVFDSPVLDNCQNIWVENLNILDGIPDSCKDMIFNLPEASFLGYEITRVSNTESYMHDKKNKKFSILFNDLKVPDSKILLACEKIKKELKEKNEFKNKRYTKWIADVRFKDQIVIRKEIRGRW